MMLINLIIYLLCYRIFIYYTSNRISFAFGKHNFQQYPSSFRMNNIVLIVSIENVERKMLPFFISINSN